MRYYIVSMKRLTKHMKYLLQSALISYHQLLNQILLEIKI